MDIYGRLTSAGTGHDALYYTRLGVENAWSLVYGEDKGIVFNPPSPPVISAFAVWLGNYRAVFLEGDRIVRSTGATATVLDTSNAPTIAASNTALNAKLTTAIGAAKNPGKLFDCGGVEKSRERQFDPKYFFDLCEELNS